MRLSRKVNDDLNSFHRFVHNLRIANITLNKGVMHWIKSLDRKAGTPEKEF